MVSISCIQKKLIVVSITLVTSVNVFCQQADSTRSCKTTFTWKATAVPLAFISTGILLTGNGRESVKNEIVEERNEIIPHFKTNIDNYLQYTPFALTYGLEAMGVPSRTDIVNKTVIGLKSELLMISLVDILKATTHVQRPDGSNYNSFPSGHTAQAFAGAALLSKEYGNVYPWIPWAAYGMAGSVGVLRMANNRHFISDVLVGAGIGILSTKVAYWTHQYKWNKKHQLPCY